MDPDALPTADSFVMKLGMRSFAQCVFYPFEYGRTLMQVIYLLMNIVGAISWMFPLLSCIPQLNPKINSMWIFFYLGSGLPFLLQKPQVCLTISKCTYFSRLFYRLGMNPLLLGQVKLGLANKKCCYRIFSNMVMLHCYNYLDIPLALFGNSAIIPLFELQLVT